MSRLRKDYDSSLIERLRRWVRAGRDYELSPGDETGEEIVESGLMREAAREERRQRELDEERVTQERLHAWAQTSGRGALLWLYRLAAIAICVPIIVFLLRAVAELPSFGQEASPTVNEVSERYLERGIEETGAVSAVAGMILDYRAFDTFGESTVLFTAACAVLMLLRIDRDKSGNPTQELIAAEENDRRYEPKNDLLLSCIARALVPIIWLYGAYVVLNGHLSPGGGFSGGAIIGAGMVLYLNAFGFKKAERFLTYKRFTRVTFLALLFYACAKSYSFFTGANGLESGIPKGVPGAIISAGLILPLNICVGLIVAFTIYAFYVMFRKGGF